MYVKAHTHVYVGVISPSAFFTFFLNLADLELCQVG